MLTYIPIVLSQGIATRSAVRATPRPPVKATAVHSQPKSKTTSVFHLPKVKSELMSKHRISCFKFSKGSPSQVSSLSDSKNHDEKIIHNDPVVPTTCADNKRPRFHERDGFMTPVNQIRDAKSICSRSEFSEVTVSTIHENLEEYKRQNSQSGFWSPVLSESSYVLKESRCHTQLGAKYPSLADASRSREAIIYKNKFGEQRYMFSPHGRIMEDLINNMLAILSAMFPRMEPELLSMKIALFTDILGSDTPRENESKIMEELDYFRINNTRKPVGRHENKSFDLEKHYISTQCWEKYAEESSDSVKGVRTYLEEILELYKERTKMLKFEIEEKIDEALAEQREEAIQIELATRKQTSLIDRIKQLEEALKKTQSILREKKEELRDCKKLIRTHNLSQPDSLSTNQSLLDDLADE